MSHSDTLNATQGDDVPQIALSPLKTLTFIALSVIALMYVAVAGTFGRFPNLDQDEIFYKAPGREWAKTGYFRAPELTGYLGVKPGLEDAWLIYPPVYPITYGLFVKLFGFGWRQSVVFDAVIHCGVAFLTAFLAWRLSQRIWPGVVAFVSVLCLGALGRPDDLAVSFGLVGVLMVLKSFQMRHEPISNRELIASGIAFGLCGATSPVAAIVIGGVALPCMLWRSGGWVTAIRMLGFWMTIATVVLILVIAPVAIKSPEAYKQFFAQSNVILKTDTRSMIERLFSVLTVGRRLSWPFLGLFGLGFVSLVPALIRKATTRWLYLWLGPTLGIGLLLLTKIHNYSYLWFLVPFLTASFFGAIARNELFGRRLDRSALALGMVLIGIGSLQFFRETLILAMLPREQTLDYNADLIRREVPPGSTILNYDLWWALGNEYRIFEHQVPAKHWGEVHAVVSTTGSPIGSDAPRQTPRDEYVAAYFETSLDRRNPDAIRLGPLTLSKSFRGFGVHVLKRKTEVALLNHDL